MRSTRCAGCVTALRRSEVGFDFFEHLHYDYYSFSPQVVAMMQGDPRAP